MSVFRINVVATVSTMLHAFEPALRGLAVYSRLTVGCMPKTKVWLSCSLHRACRFVCGIQDDVPSGGCRSELNHLFTKNGGADTGVAIECDNGLNARMRRLMVCRRISDLSEAVCTGDDP